MNHIKIYVIISYDTQIIVVEVRREQRTFLLSTKIFYFQIKFLKV